MTTKTEHANIFVALCHAQRAMKGPAKDAVNPHFKNKYADLASVVDAVRGPLTENGISWFHVHEPGDGRDYMTTVLAHGASATEIRCPVPLLIGKGDMQGYKSATTYAKRIGLESVTGVAPDDDDDGNAAAKNPPASVAPPRRTMDMDDHFATGDGIRLPRGMTLDNSQTPRERAEAAAAAIIKQFDEPKTSKGMPGVWSRNQPFIDKFSEKHSDLFAEVLDAYNARLNGLLELEEEEASA